MTCAGAAWCIARLGSEYEYKSNHSVDNHGVRPVVKGTGAACIAFLLALTACSSAENAGSTARTIKIGVDLPLTGSEGPAGLSTLNGVRFFVHRHPTLDGFNIAVDARDYGTGATGDSSRSVQNLQGFIADPQVVAMIGPLDSSVARAQIPIANLARMAMVSPATSSRCLTKEPFLPTALNPMRSAITCKTAGLPSPGELRPTGVNNYFRLSTTDELQGPAAADYASKRLHLHRVAVVSDNEVYGQGLADSFIARFNKLGGSVVAREQVDPSQRIDITAFLQRAKSDDAQGLYFGGTSSNNACAVRSQMTIVFGAGTATPLFGGDGIALDPACVRDAGADASGIYATVPTADAERIDSAQPVIAAFRSQYGRPGDFGPYTIAAYDATGVVYDALDRAIRATGGNLPARDSIVAELAATTAFSGATGVFGFDSEGDTTLRLLSIFEPAGPDPRTGWKWVGTVDYSAALPY
jgi:branched-chain amino acid transport system substrate-binding protein